MVAAWALCSMAAVAATAEESVLNRLVGRPSRATREMMIGSVDVDVPIGTWKRGQSDALPGGD